jgi:prepilin-type processing-associated H-X9-DG protein
MTWLTRLLPYIGQQALWNQILDAYRQDFYVLNSPPHTARYVSVPLFLCPSDGQRGAPPHWKGPPAGTMSYLGIAGINLSRRNGIFFLDSHIRFLDIKDGLSNTLAMGERPANLKYGRGMWHGGNGAPIIDSFLGVRQIASSMARPHCPEEGPTKFQPGRLDDPCSVYHYWSFHPGGGNFLVADGSVRFLPYSAAPLLPALATRAGRETAAWPE